MGPGVIVLQRKGCLLLWSDFGNLSRNPPIRADELIETLFISCCDSCVWPSGTWLVFHVAVATAETRHPRPYCANIHCLVSLNVQQASMNVIGCNFFPHGGIQLHAFASYALPCRRHFVRLPLCCHLLHGSKM